MVGFYIVAAEKWVLVPAWQEVFLQDFFADTDFFAIYKKVLAGKRLNRDEGIRILRDLDLPRLGFLANQRTRQKHGKRVLFVRNQHLNPTNICVYNCLFCSFRRDAGEEGAYFYSLDEIRQRVRDMDADLRELHIVSGLHPDLPFDYYLDMLHIIRAERPHVHIKAFTAVEIQYFVDRFGISAESVLQQLQAAGLNAMPGGGAEIFSERIQRKLFRQKASSQQWLEIHALAHRLGIITNATMLYGHIETAAEVVDHFITLRRQQDSSGGFSSFIPLAYQHDNNSLSKLPQHTANYDLRIFATARLMLDNFPHIKAYWVTIGPHLAQIALNYGADELEGTVVEETIMHMAGTEKRGMSVADIRALISSAGLQPVERDALYGLVEQPAAGVVK
jgi:aminodeoxyfutalosine synthase